VKGPYNEEIGAGEKGKNQSLLSLPDTEEIEELRENWRPLATVDQQRARKQGRAGDFVSEEIGKLAKQYEVTLAEAAMAFAKTTYYQNEFSKDAANQYIVSYLKRRGWAS
jgi:hypothetical protein